MKSYFNKIGIYKLLRNNNKIILILSFIFGIFYLYGDIVVKSTTISLFEIVKCFGVFLAYTISFTVVYYFITKDGFGFDNEHDGLINWTYVLIIGLFWLPHLIVRYPIAFWYDEYVELMQGLGELGLSTHFPLYYTYLITGFYRFGEMIGNHNTGLFLLVAIKSFICILIFAYTLTTLSKIKVKRSIVYLALFFYCCCPFVAGNIGSSVKDIYYSSYISLLCIQLFKYYLNRNAFYNNKSDIILLCLSILFTILYRKNGVYVIVLTLIFFVINELRTSKNIKMVVIVILTLIASCVTYEAFNYLSNAQKGSVAEALSIPFQQTARFVKYHEDLVTDEEKEAIDKILVYDKLPELYSERLSDPVKDNRGREINTEILKDYLGVWFKQFFKSPSTYIEATLRQNIYIIYPGVNIHKYNVECNAGFLDGADQSTGLVQSPIYIKETIQPLYWGGLNLLHEIPVLSLFNNMAIYIELCIFVFIEVLKDKRKELSIIMIPLIVTILIIIAGPTIYTHPRYAYPIIWSFPIWIAILYITKNGKVDNDIIQKKGDK